jgi:uncharacterized membrane protein
MQRSIMFGRLAQFAALILISGAAFENTTFAHAEANVPIGMLAVDGLPIGGSVSRESAIFKQYACSPSDQFRDLVYCKRTKAAKQSGGPSLTTTTSLYHDAAGVVAYVNQFLEPALFTRADIDSEVARLSTKFGQKPRIVEARKDGQFPQGVIAVWGALTLTPLTEPHLTTLRDDKSPKQGVLVDYLGNFVRSVQLGFPVFAVQGKTGYVWAANYDDQGRGTLRFFAIDAGRLAIAHLDAPAPSSNADVKSHLIPEAPQKAQMATAKLEQQILECGESCPEKPDVDKKRLETIAAIEKASIEAHDAERFAAAAGNEDALRAYISWCESNRCEFKNQAIVQQDAIQRSKSRKIEAETEEAQFRSARGTLADLRRYIADCNICEFAKDASREIQDLAAKYGSSVFELEVCNQDFLAAKVAFGGKPDANTDIWLAEGWQNVGSGECKTVGVLRKGTFYVTATNARHTWTEGEIKELCGGWNDFARVWLLDNSSCANRETKFKFGEMSFTGSEPKYRWTLFSKPWSYSALAYSDDKRHTGFAEGYSSPDEAIDKSLELCSESAADCKLAHWTRDDACLTLATGPSADGRTALGWSWGNGKQREAILACQRDGGLNCQFATVACGFK